MILCLLGCLWVGSMLYEASGMLSGIFLERANTASTVKMKNIYHQLGQGQAIDKDQSVPLANEPLTFLGGAHCALFSNSSGIETWGSL